MTPNPEAAIYGVHWDSFHGGYFSDPDVASPLAAAVVAMARRADVRTIVDLGGGTGFVLSRLESHGLDGNVRLVNLDASPEQIAQAHSRHISISESPESRIQCVQASIATFNRAQAAYHGDRVLWIMRSALHYFGQAGMPAVLRHLRAQAEPGEFFVHQTACFDHARDADCLNTLYRAMRTGKWYPTVDHLHRMLSEAGWHVQDTSPAPALPLAARDLAARYGIAPGALRRIRGTLSCQFGAIDGVLTLMPDDFCAHLHYRIVTCIAGPLARRS